MLNPQDENCMSTYLNIDCFIHTHFCIYMNILVLHQILKLFLKGPDGFGLLLLEEFLFWQNELAYQTLD